ncbi:sosondowah ankyrin repeat domain family Cb [Danio aesculapii]|uniref:sosondowah ankyrin repeat domain family Cb n=1 Tax=Danio aesculapii TaxID=1142201 RepID=UPI0024BF90B2|nr:sosondowah ankyrin repeat domain family Cb [Danio aesculapii]
MATECSQHAVLCFIKERGGRVKNGDLADYFRATSPQEPALKQEAREAFKRHVDTVAYVKEENGEKYVCLRKRFRACPRSSRGERANTDDPARAQTPASGYGTADAGGAETHPHISDEGVNGRTEAELRAHMENSDSSRSAEHRPKAAEQPEERAAGTGKEERDGPKSPGQVSSSPAVQQRDSGEPPGRCKECPRADSDYEAAAVTLEPLEHAWMMSASDGHWESLRPLLHTEPALVARKDFVTGFTCLHWAAKLGKHELIVLLVRFAREHRVTVNVNARSSAGYTPLHLAAMHNHLEVVKLLIGALDADVEARDYYGRKACQYLKSDVAQNILEIAGACAEAAGAGEAEAEGEGEVGRWRLSRVLQSSFRPLRIQNQNQDCSDEDSVAKQKPLRRKSSFTKMKPRVRLRAQIVHSTSLMDRFEKEESPKLSRPKSNLFG